MNQKLCKTTFIACAMAAMIMAPAAAHPFRDAPDRHPERRPERECPKFPDFQEKEILMGTVKSVDTEKNIIVVTDADGKDKSVHVNPMTHITKMLPPPTKDRPPVFDELPLSEIKNGMWVTVKDFNTGTETIEAEHINVKTEAS